MLVLIFVMEPTDVLRYTRYWGVALLALGAPRTRGPAVGAPLVGADSVRGKHSAG
jgi:hypothetical protein